MSVVGNAYMMEGGLKAAFRDKPDGWSVTQRMLDDEAERANKVLRAYKKRKPRKK